MESKGIFYFVLMGILAFLCVCGIATFCKNIKNNYWWRWIYIFGGSYVLFDLFAIAIELKVWNDLLLFMFDVNSQYWNIVWGFFIILGAFVFCLGMKLLKQRKEQIVKERIEGGANEKAVLRLFINCPFVCINFDFFWLNKARQLYMDF